MKGSQALKVIDEYPRPRRAVAMMLRKVQRDVAKGYLQVGWAALRPMFPICPETQPRLVKRQGFVVIKNLENGFYGCHSRGFLKYSFMNYRLGRPSQSDRPKRSDQFVK